MCRDKLLQYVQLPLSSKYLRIGKPVLTPDTIHTANLHHQLQISLVSLGPLKIYIIFMRINIDVCYMLDAKRRCINSRDYTESCNEKTGVKFNWHLL